MSFFVSHRETHFEREVVSMWQFILGTMVGGFFGIAIMCIVQVGSRNDK